MKTVMAYLSTATFYNYVVSILKPEVNLNNIYKFGVVRMRHKGVIAI
jgi:hypothetical protein